MVPISGMRFSVVGSKSYVHVFSVQLIGMHLHDLFTAASLY